MILTVENIQYAYKRVEKLIAKGLNDIPEKIRKKKSQHDMLLFEIQHYINFEKNSHRPQLQNRKNESRRNFLEDLMIQVYFMAGL